MTHVPETVDLHVGDRLRTRRRLLSLSQTQLAAAAGITFQQVQKYERGANRISASRLVQFAHALGVAPAWFFEGLGRVEAGHMKLDEAELARLTISQDYDVAQLLDALAVTPVEARKPLVKYLLFTIDTMGAIVATARRVRRAA